MTIGERQVVSVFGSNQPQPGQPDYQAAFDFGQRLAGAGLVVATGGYVGTMAAVSQGAAEVGGHVIGVTCDEIESWRPISPNRWIAEEIRYATLWERLTHLVTHNDAIVVLPGGVGTLAEAALAWNQLVIQAMPPRPFILLGDLWRNTLAAFARPDYVAPAYQDLLQLAATPQEAVEQVRAGLAGKAP